jgi:hypothetical protein
MSSGLSNDAASYNYTCKVAEMLDRMNIPDEAMHAALSIAVQECEEYGGVCKCFQIKEGPASLFNEAIVLLKLAGYLRPPAAKTAEMLAYPNNAVGMDID